MKPFNCILLMLILKSTNLFSQEINYHHETGVTLITFCPDIRQPAGVHFLYGLDYNYHFETWDLISGVDYFTDNATEGGLDYADKNINVYLGAEKVFFSGKWRAFEAAEIAFRYHEHAYDFNGEPVNEISRDIGPAVSAGLIWYAFPRCNFTAAMDVEFYYQGKYRNWDIIFNRLRFLSINYLF